MEPAATPDIISAIGSGISTALIQMVVAMLTPAIGFLAVASLMLTQGIKVTLTYLYRSPPAELIWFVIGPVSTLIPAFFTWSQPGVHWLYAACAASLLANLTYALVFKRLIGKLAPEKYERMNILTNRRTRKKGPPKGTKDRRE